MNNSFKVEKVIFLEEKFPDPSLKARVLHKTSPWRKSPVGIGIKQFVLLLKVYS